MSEWRYIAEQATTGEFLDLDLPLARDELTWTMSGSGALRGTVAPDVGALRFSDGSPLLTEWGTLLYAEADRQIRWGGILITSDFEGEAWRLEAGGFSSYPHGMAYTGPRYEKVQVDPAAVVRDVWAHLQGQPDGNLGLVVEGSTPVRIGEPLRDVNFTSGSGEVVEFEAGPYVLDAKEAPDLGDEIDSLAKEAPFDFEEIHEWNGDAIRHRLKIGYPRLGRRRTDLAFVQGDNVIDVVSPSLNGDNYANAVIGLGAGEGPTMVYRSTGKRDGRLRRTFVYSDKGIRSDARMDTRIAAELRRRMLLLEISSVDVRNHSHAPIGSWALGDDILVEAEIPWLGEISLWCRVVGWSLLDEDTARLSLKRSDSYTYGG